jgi:hypothetical protein
MKTVVSLTYTQGTPQMSDMSHTNPISSAFAKLAKSDLKFRHACPFIPTCGTTRLPLGGFLLNLTLKFLNKMLKMERK